MTLMTEVIVRLACSTPSSDNTVQIIFTQVQNLEKDMGIIYISLAG